MGEISAFVHQLIGKPCDWKGYKATCLHDKQAIAASFQENSLMIDWVKSQSL